MSGRLERERPIAMEDWVLGRAAESPPRARRLFGWLQFH